MELQRGVCSLCSDNTRVLNNSDAEEYSKLLPEILYENFLTETEFQKIKKQIKICLVCCYKIRAATETKNSFNNNKENENNDEGDGCHFCATNKNLVRIDSNWSYFVDRIEGYLSIHDFPVHVCVSCVFYFDTIFNMKTKLMYKFPQLAVQNKKSLETSPKQNITPKRKSISKSPPSSKKRKIFDDCFTYLQPLCNNNYYVDDELKQDNRLYRKIAYVNLQNSNDVILKNTPKMRPIIKIKLKPKKEASQVYLKMSRSEEPPNKSEYRSGKTRRHSHIEKRNSSEESENKLDETPKTAATSTLVPKRRVSTYIDTEEKDDDVEEKDDDIKENKEEETKEGNFEEAIINIVEKYILSNKISDDDKSEKNKEDNEVSENGIQRSDLSSSGGTEGNEELSNGDKLEHLLEKNANEDEEQEKDIAEESPSSTSECQQKTPPKIESGGEESDSESNDKNKNGSERKKKRVTFSDLLI